jgi:hypothetical protein
VNDFYKDIKFSQDSKIEEFWSIAYKKAFPALASIVSHNQNGDHQKLGVDRSLIMSNSKQILVDEKIRRIKDCGDIMLEYISNNQKNTLGWVEKDLMCDYIAYGFLPDKIVYLLPVLELKRAWNESKSEWLELYGTRYAKNFGYDTLNCPVPTTVLYDKINDMFRIEF